jgi:hypothetical protein
VPVCTQLTCNALVDDRVLPQEPRYRHDQIGPCIAAARRGYSQIRLGDIHERLPCVEAFINKGIVIARQIQSLEQRSESRHMRAEAPGYFGFQAQLETRRCLMTKIVIMSTYASRVSLV